MFKESGFAALPLLNTRVRKLVSFGVLGSAIFLLVVTAGTAHGASDPGAGKHPGGPLKILRISPSGEDVPVGKQILLEFDRPVAPLGRMERSPSEIPVAIEPGAELPVALVEPFDSGLPIE